MEEEELAQRLRVGGPFAPSLRAETRRALEHQMVDELRVFGREPCREIAAEGAADHVAGARDHLADEFADEVRESAHRLHRAVGARPVEPGHDGNVQRGRFCEPFEHARPANAARGVQIQDRPAFSRREIAQLSGGERNPALLHPVLPQRSRT